MTFITSQRYHTHKTLNCDACAHYENIMYQLQEKIKVRRFQWVSGKEKAQVYSCPWGWISYTAGSMPLVVKSYKAKKCNIGADHSLSLAIFFLVLSNRKTFFKSSSKKFMPGQYKKKYKGLQNQIKEHQTPTKYLWGNLKAALFLKSQGMAKEMTLSIHHEMSGRFLIGWKNHRDRCVWRQMG